MQRLWTQLTEQEKVEVSRASMLLRAVGSEQPFPLTLCDGRELRSFAEVEQLEKKELHDVFFYSVLGLCKGTGDLYNTTAVAMNDFTNFLEGMPEKSILQQLSEGFGGIRAQTAEARDLLQHLRETTLRNVQQALRRHCNFTEILQSQQREMEDFKKGFRERIMGGAPRPPVQKALKGLVEVVQPIKVMKRNGNDDQKSLGAKAAGLISRTDQFLLARGRVETLEAFFFWALAQAELHRNCAAAMNNLTVVRQAMAATCKGASSQDDLEQFRKSKESIYGFYDLIRLCVLRSDPSGDVRLVDFAANMAFEDVPDHAATVQGEAQPVFPADRDYCLKQVNELNGLCKELKEAEKSSTQCLTDSHDKQLTIVATLVSMLQAEKENTQKEMSRVSELEARCDYFEAISREYEAFKASLNAHASERVADHVWQGNIGRTPSWTVSQRSSWDVVASGSGQTILSTSWISVATVGPCCFLKDAIFTIKNQDGGFESCKAVDLQIGSKVLAENGDIIEVKTAPGLHVVHETVELQTESACLQISPDHRIVRPDRSTVPRPRFVIGNSFSMGSLPM